MFIAVSDCAALLHSHCDIQIYLTNRSHFHYMRLKCTQPMQNIIFYKLNDHVCASTRILEEEKSLSAAVGKTLEAQRRNISENAVNHMRKSTTTKRLKVEPNLKANNKIWRKSLINFEMIVTKQTSSEASCTHFPIVLRAGKSCWFVLLVIQV